jgi:apolipoprotein N-acyltransferase
LGQSLNRNKIRPKDILLALASGLLTGLAFPKFGLSFLIWISLIPLFFALVHKKPRQSFLLGLIAGFGFYALLLNWIPDVPAHYGGLSLGFSFLIYLVFMLYLSLFWGFFSWVFIRIRRRWPVFCFFIAPFLWVAFEQILTHLFTGFPWGLLGYAQYQNRVFIQMGTVTGVYGLSFMIVLFQSLFVLSMEQKKRRYFFVGLSTVLAVHVGGFLCLQTSPSNTETFPASVIQGNVSSDIYWDRISYEDIISLFELHMDLTDEAHSEGAELIVWPEFTVPLCFSCPYGIYIEFKERLLQFAEESGTTLLIGTNETKSGAGANEYFNTALCIGPDLKTSEYYKMHLVPFGEYTPYKKIFSFINTMTHAIGDISPGNEHVLHEVNGIFFGSPICYEIVFPNLVRQFVKNGAQFLATITNDGWYGKSSAPHQHFAIAVLRAVENRRYLLRAATTGISGIIDPYGRILQKSQLDTVTHLTERIAPLSRMTLYTRLGNVFSALCLTLSLIFFILALIRKRR